MRKRSRRRWPMQGDWAAQERAYASSMRSLAKRLKREQQETKMITKWIPEAPNHPGVYANLSDTTRQGKIHDSANLQPSTMNIALARQFDTKEECQSWCDANPQPVFVPRDHGFMEASDYPLLSHPAAPLP